MGVKGLGVFVKDRAPGAFSKVSIDTLAGKRVAIDGNNWIYGAMYRALTYFALRNGISPSDGEKLQVIARKVPIEFETHEDVNRVFINGEDVTRQIRSQEVTSHVSEVSAHYDVRQEMVAKQRRMGRHGSIVAEGRDTTTVVFADADIKIYLDASVRERAQRRLLDMARLGVSTTLEEQEAEIQRRDKLDSTRDNSPLTKARDASQ